MIIQNKLAVAVLFSCLAVFAAPNQPLQPRVTLEVSQGLCPNGAFVPYRSEDGSPADLNIWGGYCPADQKQPPLARTSIFRAPRYLRLYLSGYSSSPSLALERMSDGSKYFIVPYDGRIDRWFPYDFELPEGLVGKPVRLVLDGDANTWRAFSEPLEGSKPPPGDALKILSITALHFSLMMVCAMALVAFAVLRGVRDTVQAGVVALVGAALPGYVIFWFAFFSPRLGRYFAYLIPLAAIVGLVLCVRRLDSAGRSVLKPLLAPVFLTGVVTLLVLSTGYLNGGRRNPLGVAAMRFSHHLPDDNEIPFLVAQGVKAKNVPKPLLSDWLSSDRPPLQAGITLAQFPFFRRPWDEGYQAVGVLSQSLWIFGLWLLLSAFRVEPRAIGLVLVTCLFSGFVFVNSFFVWPKLIAAAYTLGFLAAFVAGRAKERSAVKSWIAPGCLLAFSLLSHGGAVFALLPMVVLVLFLDRPVQFRRLLATGALCAVLYLPWILYQKFFDPPGDRLLKYHLAGVEPLNSRTFSQTLFAAYSALSFHQIADYKAANFATATAHGWTYLRGVADLITALITSSGEPLPKAAAIANSLRAEAFFYIGPCLGFLMLGPLALLAGIARRFRSVEWRDACLLWLLTTASIAVWCLLMFGPAKTVVHTGSYAVILFAMAGSVLALWAVSRWLALFIAVLQIVLNVLLYAILIRTPFPGGFLPEGSLRFDTLLLCLGSLAAVFVLLGRIAQHQPREASAEI